MSEVDLRELRRRILAAARDLSVARGSALELTDAEVIAAAGVSEAEFASAYADRRAYLLALLLDFLDLARADVIDTPWRNRPRVSRASPPPSSATGIPICVGGQCASWRCTSAPMSKAPKSCAGACTASP